MLKRALGYSYDEVTYENGVEVKRVTKEVAPDVGAQCFWLKNRKPDVFRDKQNIDMNVKSREKTIQELDELFCTQNNNGPT